LSSARATINSQIQLTALKIRTAEGKIAETQRQINQLLSEIKDLTIKISELEDLLAGLSETLTNRIRLTYINELASPLDLFLSTDGFNSNGRGRDSHH
jgi:peptidoglycan hydrolase CwlO-like protein